MSITIRNLEAATMIRLTPESGINVAVVMHRVSKRLKAMITMAK
jgi:hypothetical protein